MPSSRKPRSRSVTTGTSVGSIRDIAQHLRQQYFGGLEGLHRPAIAEFGIGEEVRSHRNSLIDRRWNRERTRGFDDQKVATSRGRLSDEGSLNVALFDCSNGCVDLGLVCPEEVGTQFRGVGAGQGPGLCALGESGAEASPDLRLIFGANLKPSFL